MTNNDKEYIVATVTREEIAEVLGIEPESLTDARMESIAVDLGRACKEWNNDSWRSDIKIIASAEIVHAETHTQYEVVGGELIENYQVKPVVAPKLKRKRRSIGLYHIVMALTVFLPLCISLLIALSSH